MIKLVASDLDGTLLNDKSLISPLTQDTIKKYMEKGIIFAFCTGRGFVEMEKIFEIMPFIEYAITANGAHCFNIHSMEDVFKTLMPKKDIKFIYDKLKFLDVLFEIYSDEKIYFYGKQKDELFYYVPLQYLDLVKVSREYLSENEKFIESIEEHNGATKIHCFFSSVSERNRAYDELKDLPYDVVRQSFNELEFNTLNVNKGTAIQKLAEKFDIKKHEILAFGDNFNDISMRNAAGTLVAMDNAVEPLKNLADYITKSNNNDGIAFALEKFLK